jgi:hypothetical protein
MTKPRSEDNLGCGGRVLQPGCLGQAVAYQTPCLRTGEASAFSSSSMLYRAVVLLKLASKVPLAN